MFGRKKKPGVITTFPIYEDPGLPPARGADRVYGDGGTIHSTTILNVETDSNGVVVAVWFRCQMLPFDQHVVDGLRAEQMENAREGLPELHGVMVRDRL